MNRLTATVLLPPMASAQFRPDTWMIDISRMEWRNRWTSPRRSLPVYLSDLLLASSDQRGSIFVCFLQISTVKEFMSDLDDQLPAAFDPFAEANADDSGAGAKEYVHVRVQQRNGRKSLTTVQGLNKEFSYNKILKDLKKEFCCNGTVVQDPELGQVIQLQGDQRKNVSNFLSQTGIVKKENIKIHGF
ncbi:hypothetical protein OPV22_029806 [Ensete ventricosum]|uniref:Protein translation factor SUI1 homolog n=1 Tax=Ensete ventricosum TaxID=4639 RepID=A0AAV8Q824_ENSVE|nr:hypothetical protein OPV22_029806 [Ensete ventricosum]